MPNKIDSLTGLRFIAAFIVVLGHLTGSYRIPALHHMGGISVQLFFVLSGFVMYISYCNKLKVMTFKQFILLRIFRLYPSFIFTILIATIFLYFYNNVTDLFKHFIIDITMTQSWWGSINLAFTPIDGPIWSVSTEFLFYLIFFSLFRNISIKSSIVLFVVYLSIWTIVLHHNSSKLSDDSFLWLFYINPYYRFCDFWVGCFFAMIYKKHFELINSTLKSKLLLTSIVEVTLLIVLFGSQIFLPFNKFWWSANIFNIIGGIVLLIFSSNSGYLSRLLSTKVFVLLGESSYSLYLIHVPIFSILNLFFSNYLIPGAVEKFLLLFMPIILSILIFKFYESPLNNYLRQKMMNKK